MGPRRASSTSSSSSSSSSAASSSSTGGNVGTNQDLAGPPQAQSDRQSQDREAAIGAASREAAPPACLQPNNLELIQGIVEEVVAGEFKKLLRYLPQPPKRAGADDEYDDDEDGVDDEDQAQRSDGTATGSLALGDASLALAALAGMPVALQADGSPSTTENAASCLQSGDLEFHIRGIVERVVTGETQKLKQYLARASKRKRAPDEHVVDNTDENHAQRAVPAVVGPLALCDTDPVPVFIKSIPVTPQRVRPQKGDAFYTPPGFFHQLDNASFSSGIGGFSPPCVQQQAATPDAPLHVEKLGPAIDAILRIDDSINQKAAKQLCHFPLGEGAVAAYDLSSFKGKADRGKRWFFTSEVTNLFERHGTFLGGAAHDRAPKAVGEIEKALALAKSALEYRAGDGDWGLKGKDLNNRASVLLRTALRLISKYDSNATESEIFDTRRLLRARSEVFYYEIRDLLTPVTEIRTNKKMREQPER